MQARDENRPRAASNRGARRILALTPTVLTIGHSTRPIEEFLRLLDNQGVTRLVDVRTIPRSRHNPQFNKDSLPNALKSAGIAYMHMSGLGGLRHPRKNSTNLGWRNAGFRGFADYMQTRDFENALAELIAVAKKERLAIMCAEAVPWRCHRSLIADALLVHGVRVEEISSATRTQPYKLSPFAQVFGTEVSYPGLPFEQASEEKSS